MKKILPIIAFLLICAYSIQAQSEKNKSNPEGKWKFEAPYAPEGYTSGTIEVTFTEKKFSTSISFTGNDYKIPGEKVTVGNDSLKFVVYVESNPVSVNLKMTDANKMEGKAYYPAGEIPLTVSKDIK